MTGLEDATDAAVDAATAYAEQLEEVLMLLDAMGRPKQLMDSVMGLHEAHLQTVKANTALVEAAADAAERTSKVSNT